VFTNSPSAFVAADAVASFASAAAAAATAVSSGFAAAMVAASGTYTARFGAAGGDVDAAVEEEERARCEWRDRKRHELSRAAVNWSVFIMVTSRLFLRSYLRGECERCPMES
jgi:hypothetical protein